MKKKIAVVGAGFTGVAAAWHLSHHASVSVFDSKGLGGEASGIAAGLLHPYPGKHGRLSQEAYEGMTATLNLLSVAEHFLKKPVCNRQGIIKKGGILYPGKDLEKLLNGSTLIHSGITVFPRLYLGGLWMACEKNGALLIDQQIENLSQLEKFDHIVLCVGYGIKKFTTFDFISLKFIKGQTLTCALSTPLERSVIDKHYLAVTQNPHYCLLGGTYEHTFTSVEPDIGVAKNLLNPLSPVKECYAGIRVGLKDHYMPKIFSLDSKTYAITGLGSRGLLYHALLAENLTRAIIKA